MTLKTTAQRAVLALIQRVSDSAQTHDQLNNGANIGKLLEGCAAVLRAMDEVTVIDE